MNIPKYRAYHKQRKIMMPVLEIRLDPESGGVFVEDDHAGSCECHLYKDFWSWRDIELMQFTGLQDHTGKDIYEGDIARSTVLGGHGTVTWIADQLSGKLGFVILFPNKMQGNILFDVWEVIGNIWEHQP